MFTQEHDLFRQSVRSFIEQEVKPNIQQWEEEEQLPRSVFRRMGELGFLGINFPEEYGGTNNDFYYSVVYLEELAKAGFAGLSAAVSVHQYMATNHILRAGSNYLKEKYLPGSIDGSLVGSIAITEPGTGSDVAQIRTTARREGDYYIINGSKTFITNGYYGQFVTVACKTDPAAGIGGISLIVVDNDTPGFSRNKLKKMGWKSSDTAELFFDQVKVPVNQLVGQEGKGFLYIMDSFQLERLAAAIMSVAGCDYALDITLKYMQERTAFGKPIAKYQALRHRLVDLATELEVTRQFTYHCCRLFHDGVFAVKECSMAKLKATELGKQIADECLQMFGGYGWMSEYPIERAYRDARVATIVAGTSEIMREIISKMVIDGVNYEAAYNQMKEDAATETHQPGASTNNQNKPTMEQTPTTAAEIIRSLPNRVREEKIADAGDAMYHFILEGDTGGEFTVEIANKAVKVHDGLQGTAVCESRMKASLYEELELGKANPQMAFMMGKVKVSNVGEMLKFAGFFKRLF